jgi:hypothetical protein
MERKLSVSELGLLVHTGCTKMLEQISAGVSFPRQNTAKRSYQYRPMYRVTAPTSAHLSPVYLSVTTLKHRSVFSCKCNWRHFTNPLFLPVRPFVSAPEPLKGCDGPWSDVSVWPLIEVEGVLCVCCGVWFHGQSELTIIKWKCVMCIYCISCEWSITQLRCLLLNVIFQFNQKPLMSHS